ncbi:MAG TPA: bifunctional DNA-formamidopyrimidine glycosylase/DNA-(apurinic or apyrimidinic site) lyase [Candidatus Dormibacteraeota bacterium]|nr:bifunctional DNA-formamidopyrimidine glycosylase/DNA-(apurinic or apyrimidinic site) lyase [Candidatus Dormibacteraeota bacterium]
MPELPEVETIKRGLDAEIAGQTIAEARALWAKSFPDAKKAIGHKVKSLDRRGKVLIMNLNRDMSLMFHLKMTGQLVLQKKGGQRFAGGHPTASMEHNLPDKSTRAVFTFKNGDKLFFNDQRKFGWIKLVETAHVNLDKLLVRMGPEPLGSAFTPDVLTREFKSHARAPVKAVILDQSTVSGVGNIYADESLHLAKIHPARLAGSLKSAEVKRLHIAIKAIIKLGIKHGGTSFTHYVNALGKQGDYLQYARVFRRQGKPCPVCATEIVKTRVAGRGTHYCPKCQKLGVK